MQDAYNDRLSRDLKRQIEWHIGLIGRPEPIDPYVFNPIPNTKFLALDLKRP